MTWTKLGDEYSDEIANACLSDAAYRTHTEAIGWVYRMEDLKLRIPKHLLRRFAGSDCYEAAVKELADLGFWRDRGDTWEVIHHAAVIRQSIDAQKQMRDRNRRAQKAHRSRSAASEKAPPVSAAVSADISDAVSDASDRQTDPFHRPATHQRRSK